MTLPWEEDSSKLAGMKAAVVGLGKSNLALAEFLADHGAFVSARDEKGPGELGADAVAEARSRAAEVVLGEGYLEGLEEFDAVFLTPGMRKDLPQVRRAREKGVPISGEVPLFLALCRGTVIGVTGSAGKTTTTSLAGLIMRRSHPKVFVGGNIGTPLIKLLDRIDEQTYVVMELSSFQLELTKKSPRVGVITNLSPDHLNIHDTMDNYVRAKANIVRFQGPGDFAVLNRDNPQGWAFSEYAGGEVASFSRTCRCVPGAFLDGQWVWFADPGGLERAVFPVSSLRIPGRHNVENALAATAAAMLCGASPDAAASAAAEFEGVEHRMELVRELDRVRYYNDSIATAPDRAMAALETLPGPIVLIAGGYDKQVSFDRFGEAVAGKVRVLVLLGRTAQKIRAAVESALSAPGRHATEVIEDCEDLEKAVLRAREHARPGESVILSPACASFDMFRSFEERGRLFKRIVWSLDR